jgi:RNA polymerase sigma factor (TIGR02999 family)
MATVWSLTERSAVRRGKLLERSPLCITILCHLPSLGSQAIEGAMKDEVTSILLAVEQGDPHAAERLLPLVYDELRALASRRLAHEKPGQTLQATALVHEAYIRLVDTEKVQHWNSRGHFFAAAAEAMRRILIEKARQKSTQRRGQGHGRRELRDADLVASALGDELLDLDEALTRLTAIDADAAVVAKLRLFVGMSVEQIAEIQQSSPRTVKRNWAQARAWLGRALAEPKP